MRPSKTPRRGVARVFGVVVAALAAVGFAGCNGGSGPGDAGPQDVGTRLDVVDVSTDQGPTEGGPACDTSLRQCTHAFSWTFTAGSIQPDVVEVRGSFNNWSPGALRMAYSNGAWRASAVLPWGTSVEYKFWAQWNNNPDNPLWLTDPNNPTVASDGNSQLQNLTCPSWTCQPAPLALRLVAPPVTSATGYSFQVEVTPSTAVLDATLTRVTLNGAAVSVPYDATMNRFTVSVSSGVTSPNKYGYVFRVQSVDGRTASLYAPLWIEATPFQWQDAFMYEVMIDRFLAGGTSLAGANGAPTDPVGDWKGGDFGGVTRRIQDGYFDAMGVNALWISSPIVGTRRCEMGTGGNAGHCLSGYHSYFPLATGWIDGSENDPMFSSHGITTPIDPHFGTAADLQALVNTAHAHGIRVLTDLVVNHVFADPAPPSGQSPELAPLWTAHQSDPAWFNLPYNASLNDCGNESLWDAPTSQLWNRTNCWFDPYLPDLNSSSPVVDDAVAAHAVWLMETFNLDGFRVDAAKQVANNVCIALRTSLSAATGTDVPFYMVGEALGNVVGNVMDCVGPDRLDGSMNDPLHNAIVSTFLQGSENANSFDGDLQYDESTWTGTYPNALMGHFFGSHDVPRAISQAAQDVGDPWNAPPPAHETSPSAFARLGMAQAFLLTYDSLPILWMGDEFGMPGSVDPDNRRLMRFGTALSAQEATTLTGLQRLGTTRAAHSALRRGTRTRLWVDDTFYAFGRVDGGDIVVAAFNLDPAQSVTHAVPVNNIGLTGTVTDVLSGTAVTVSGDTLTLTLGPLTAAVFTH